MSSFLKHYASKYYDPQKAHEYYMRTRELKGRKQSSAKLNSDGKKIWDYTKDTISKEHASRKKQLAEQTKRELAQAAREYRREVEMLKNRADSVRKDIENKVAVWKKLYANANDKKMISIKMAPIMRRLQTDIMAAKIHYGHTNKDINIKRVQESKNMKTEYESIKEAEYNKILQEYAAPAKARKGKKQKKVKEGL